MKKAARLNSLERREIINLKKWYETADDIFFNEKEEEFKLELRSNYYSWEKTKQNIQTDEPLYMVIKNKSQSENQVYSFALTLAQMKTLNEYLKHKIKYLEE